MIVGVKISQTAELGKLELVQRSAVQMYVHI